MGTLPPPQGSVDLKVPGSNSCLLENKQLAGRWLEVMALERFLGGLRGWYEAFLGFQWGAAGFGVILRLPHPFQNQSNFQNDLSRLFPRSRPDLTAIAFPRFLCWLSIAAAVRRSSQFTVENQVLMQGLWGYRCFHVRFNESAYSIRVKSWPSCSISFHLAPWVRIATAMVWDHNFWTIFWY